MAGAIWRRSSSSSASGTEKVAWMSFNAFLHCSSTALDRSRQAAFSSPLATPIRRKDGTPWARLSQPSAALSRRASRSWATSRNRSP